MPTEYALYLRKSRADLEAEAHGEGDTLARHEHILMELAKSRALPIGAIYREIVSGERIASCSSCSLRWRTAAGRACSSPKLRVWRAAIR